MNVKNLHFLLPILAVFGAVSASAVPRKKVLHRRCEGLSSSSRPSLISFTKNGFVDPFEGQTFSPEGIYLADKALVPIHILLHSDSPELRIRAIQSLRWDKIPTTGRRLIVEYAEKAEPSRRFQNDKELSALARLAVRHSNPMWLPVLKQWLANNVFWEESSIRSRIFIEVQALERKIEKAVATLENGLSNQIFWSERFVEDFAHLNTWGFFSDKQKDRILRVAENFSVAKITENYLNRKTFSLLLQCASAAGDLRWNQALLNWREQLNQISHSWAPFLLSRIAVSLNPSLRIAPPLWGFQAQSDHLHRAGGAAEQLKSLVHAGRFHISDHALERMNERGINKDQIFSAFDERTRVLLENYDVDRDSLVFSWQKDLQVKVIFSFAWENGEQRILVITAYRPNLPWFLR